MNQPIDKVTILARGLGTRMRRQDNAARLDARQEAVAETGVKAMIPIDRPFLDYVLTALADAGYHRVCLVIGPDHDAIRDYYTRQVQPERLEISFAVQPEPKGTADAVLAAEAFAGDDPFVMLNSDNYYPVEALRGLRTLPGAGVALFDRENMLSDSNIEPERLLRFAVAEITPEGNLKRILEKPDEAMLARLPQPLWVSMNCWRFGSSIFKACRAIGPSPRGEFEVPDAVQYAIDNLGESFRALTLQAAVLDLTSRQDVGPVAEKLSGMEVRF